MAVHELAVRRPRRKLLLRVARTSAVLVALLGAALWYTTQPLLGAERASAEATVDAARLERHVRVLAGDLAPRDSRHPENLARAAEYVRTELMERLGNARLLPFRVQDHTYHNVSACAGPESAERIVVGAHYDAAEPGMGADDNASGVAGLIELAAMLAREELATRVELVASRSRSRPGSVRVRWAASCTPTGSGARACACERCSRWR